MDGWMFSCETHALEWLAGALPAQQGFLSLTTEVRVMLQRAALRSAQMGGTYHSWLRRQILCAMTREHLRSFTTLVLAHLLAVRLAIGAFLLDMAVLLRIQAPPGGS